MSTPPKDPGRSQAPSAQKRRGKGNSSQDWLGDQLRDLYGAYADEPLPDDLRSLLDQLDDRTGAPGSGKGRKA